MTEIKRILVLALMLTAIFAFSITAMAAEMEEDQGENITEDTSSTEELADPVTVTTDSANNLVLEAADVSISDIARLLDGQSPSDITGNAELADYSIYSIYSVTATGDYDFENEQQLSVNTKDISSDMDVKVMFLDKQGSWGNMPFEFNSGVISVTVSEEGQVAIFRHSEDYDAEDEETSEETTEETSEETTEKTNEGTEKTDSSDSQEKTSPKTYDNIALFAVLTLIGASGIIITSKYALKK